MSSTDPPSPAGPSGGAPPPPPLARLVGRRPNQGAADAAKTVIADVRELVRAEVELAKAEVAEGVKAKVLGAGFFIAVAVVGWLAVQVLLVLLGFLFALFLPGWAAVLLVLVLLLAVMGVFGFLGYRKLKTSASLTTTKQTVAESTAATKAAVEQAKANARSGVEEAKVAVKVSAEDVKQRVTERIGGGASGR
jgi:uncharacterized membrane protein YqjE